MAVEDVGADRVEGAGEETYLEELAALDGREYLKQYLSGES